MFTHSTLKRFVKDYSLPIQLFREPYFDYFLKLYNKQFSTQEKFDLLSRTIESLDGESNFMEQYHKIKEDILNTMKENKKYIEFNSISLEEFDIPSHNFSKNNVFNCKNVGKIFISIDLKKANFQAMKYYSSDLVLNHSSYESFMDNFTDLEYMKQSKYIRQVIFGNLNPKRQIKIQQYLTYNLLKCLIEGDFIKKEDVKMLSPDEIVCEFNIEDYLLYNNYDIHLQNIIKNEMRLDVDVEIYNLKQIGTFDYYVKEFINKTGYEIMCVPVIYFAQIYKLYNNIDLNDYDLTFFYENQVAMFLKPLNLLENNL